VVLLMKRKSLEELRRQLMDPLTVALATSKPGRIELLCPERPVADDPTKLSVHDRGGRPVAVVLCSAPVAPDLVARGMQRARDAKRALGSELGRVILDPLGEGRLDGLSYTILPYCEPLRDGWLLGRLQSWRLGHRVFSWLRSVTRKTVSEVDPGTVEADFARPLTHLIELEEMPLPVRAAAEVALDRLSSKAWQPRHVLAHNDLWKGNILIDRSSRSGPARDMKDRFVIIDWPGAMVRGYALYDLVRLAQSFRLTRSGLAQEVSRHCDLLSCSPADAPSHLLTALGHVGLHLEHFPTENYVRMAASCLSYLGVET
jgi:hypothetical protein